MSRIAPVPASVVVLGAGAALGVGQTKDAVPAADMVRIGTYDNRSIAVAYAASRHNPVKEKVTAFKRAKVVGDRDAIKELESWGQKHQRLLHFMGFGHVPVPDLLETVTDGVKEAARRRGLAAITMACDFTSGNVELVDVTEDLVKLYDPTEKTLKTALGVRSAKPVDLIRLADMPAKH
jgi:hypothetical protein